MQIISSVLKLSGGQYVFHKLFCYMLKIISDNIKCYMYMGNKEFKKVVIAQFFLVSYMGYILLMSVVLQTLDNDIYR